MLEHAYYSVISPEGCAGILWKSHQYAELAAKALRFTSKDLLGFGIVDSVIDEPLGGAHRDPHRMAARLKQYLAKTLRELTQIPVDHLLPNRYEKFRRMGAFMESAFPAEPATAGPTDGSGTGSDSATTTSGDAGGTGESNGASPVKGPKANPRSKSSHASRNGSHSNNGSQSNNGSH